MTSNVLIEVVGGTIYVTCHSVYAFDGEVKILDLDGNLKQRLGVNHDGTFMFKLPFFLTVKAKSNRLYISDYLHKQVTCLMSDGTVIYQYTDPELKRPRGVCVDDDDNITICDEASRNLHIVTEAGKKHRILLT